MAQLYIPTLSTEPEAVFTPWPHGSPKSMPYTTGDPSLWARQGLFWP